METPADWHKTVRMQERLRNEAFFEEPSKESRYGKWQGRNIIGRDCPINGGVYLGGGEREAIVVDDKEDPELSHAYQELIKRRKTKEQRGESFKDGVLGEVFDLTKELLPYSDAKVAQVTRGLQPDQKISLSSFLIAKGGICRHQALLAGYLLEKLKSDGHISGQVSIDRNYVPGQGGHAWVRYVNSAGKVFIIDPAQDFIGKIEEAGEDQWFYKRPSTFVDTIRDLLKGKK